MNETMPKPNLSVFFPVYNDEKTVERVTLKAIKALEKYANKFEVIIINDCSPDNSGAIADKLAAQFNFVKVIHHERNLGYGAALKTGFKHAQYEFICFKKLAPCSIAVCKVFALLSESG